jgi:hypothetical protein
MVANNKLIGSTKKLRPIPNILAGRLYLIVIPLDITVGYIKTTRKKVKPVIITVIVFLNFGYFSPVKRIKKDPKIGIMTVKKGSILVKLSILSPSIDCLFINNHPILKIKDIDIACQNNNFKRFLWRITGNFKSLSVIN